MSVRPPESASQVPPRRSRSPRSLGIMIPPSDAADEPADNFDRVNAINPAASFVVGVALPVDGGYTAA
jgi:hypothetical protein